VDEKMKITKQKLVAFEKYIAKLYNKGKIKYPVHLAGGNEDTLMSIFKDYKPNDWIFSTWRSHFHWILSGRDIKELKRQIIEHGSMHIFDKKFFTSAIVGGIAPIALGVAKALKMKNSPDKVWCFLGCAGARCGISMECIEYAIGQDLPIIFVIEDNDRCVRASTSATWGKRNGQGKIIHYQYERLYHHAGSSKEGEERKYIMF
jgi:pyruvate dehydrogenase E1 component alpha subunit